ncbi:MAG TPA: type II toxin-antitoxin system RelE/ParE family toxin [Allosphingosinicella sp.]|jgi:phage-related protein
MYELKQWPATVYVKEVEPLHEVREEADAVLFGLRKEGPNPLGYDAKNLGKDLDYLWQINIKKNRNQYRLLYAPYANKIVVFHFHKKRSKQEQQRGYAKARNRKKDFEDKYGKDGAGGRYTIH